MGKVAATVLVLGSREKGKLWVRMVLMMIICGGCVSSGTRPNCSCCHNVNNPAHWYSTAGPYQQSQGDQLSPLRPLLFSALSLDSHAGIRAWLDSLVLLPSWQWPRSLRNPQLLGAFHRSG